MFIFLTCIVSIKGLCNYPESFDTSRIPVELLVILLTNTAFFFFLDPRRSCQSQFSLFFFSTLPKLFKMDKFKPSNYLPVDCEESYSPDPGSDEDDEECREFSTTSSARWAGSKSLWIQRHWRSVTAHALLIAVNLFLFIAYTKGVIVPVRYTDPQHEPSEFSLCSSSVYILLLLQTRASNCQISSSVPFRGEVRTTGV